MKKYLIGVAILAGCACLLAWGLHGFPPWLRVAGVSIAALYLLGGSVYVTIRLARGEKIIGTQLEIHPRSWRRWILDEPDQPPKKQP